MADLIQIKVSATGATAAIRKLTELNNLIQQIRNSPVTLNTTQITRGTQAVDNFSRTTQQAQTQVRAYSQGVEQASKQHGILGDSMASVAAKMAVWQVMGTLVSKAIGSITEALDTMKAVDDELVVVRKVTGATTDELKAIEEQAYKTASAYGVAADEYLASISAFARAGYADQSEALAELATKTQLVGDTDAETAQQFLLSVDAAYKYEGSIEKLTQVLDGANEIDNKYATSIEKIAEGLGTVAPIAAQAHVGIDELSAAIGTITAVTQRTGQETATALRALFLNIMGDTKTEIDEGVTWTTGEIEGLRDLIKIYASDVYEAAQASGEVINPMEAMGALAQSMKEGLLTEQEVVSMVSDIGGKLRSSQLLALIQNWDMYESMLADYKNAVGSADAEIENAMDSWTRKTEILKNTWTEFISHLVETDTIKGALDIAVGLVDALDSGVGRVAVGVGVLSAAFVALKAANPELAAIAAAITAVGAVVGYVNSKVNEYEKSLREANPALYELADANDAATEALENAQAAAKEETSTIEATAETARLYVEALQDLEDAGLNTAEAQDRYAAVVSSLNTLVPSLNLTINEQTGLLDQQTSSILANIEAWKEKAVQDALQSKYTAIYEQQAELIIARTAAEQGLAEQTERREAAEALLAQQEASYITDTDALLNMTREEILANDELADAIADTKAEIDDATHQEELYQIEIDEANDTLAAYDEQLEGLNDVSEALTDTTGELTENTEDNTTAIQEQVDALKSLEDELTNAQTAIENFEEATKTEKGDTFKDYAEIYSAFLSDYQSGMLGSNTYKAAIQTFLGEDVLAGLNYDWKAAGEMLASDFWQGVFSGGGDDYGANFANALYEIADAEGNLYDGNGNLVASFAEVDGALQMQIESAQGLADELGVPIDVIYAVMDALDIFSSGLMTSRDDMLALAESVGALQTSAEGLSSVDVSAFLTGLAESGTSTADIWDLYNALVSMEDVDLTNVPEDIGAFITEAQAAQGDITATGDALDELNGKEAEPSVELDTSAFDRQVSRVKETLNRLSLTRTIIKVASNAAASGTDSAPGGATLVNEEGPEIIQEGGTARIAGAGQPTITDVEPGAKIFTAEETKRILQGRALNSLIRAARDGYSAGGIPLSTTGTVSVSSGTATVVAAASTDAQEAIEDEIKLLKSELDLMEKQGRSVEERKAKMQQIQDALHREAEYLRSIGAEQTEINKLSSEWWEIQGDILKLQEEIWDELETAVDEKLKEAQTQRDAETAAIDEQIAALREKNETEEDSLKLEKLKADVLEKQNELLEAQQERTVRIYNAATGQWEWIANAGNVKNAQEALKSARDSLSDYERQLSLDAAIAELEAKKELIEANYDALEAEWDAIMTSIEEPGRDIATILADIAENGAPLMKAQVENVGSMLARLSAYIASATAIGTTVMSGATVSGAYGFGSSGLLGGSNALRAASNIRTVNSRNGNDYYNCNTYSIGGISLSASEAASMSVASLASRARTLSVYKNM